MTRPFALALLALPTLLATAFVDEPDPPAAPEPRAAGESELPRGEDGREQLPPGHLDRVMTSRFCAECHPAIYAEHAQNTHGRAFTDEEVRLATGRFDHGDCIRCHTPRPVFETGIGLNPMRRYHNLEEGNTCMTCHLKPGHDYSTFRGGAECKEAFDPRVGEVEACASCHRNHGTPYQWELAETGKLAGRSCVDCHMARVKRPVAVGEEPRLVRSHVFPGGRSETQLRRAYDYEARIEGNEVVVRITNDGAGHNFPTELKQRAVESLVVVRDASGREVARSRMVFRDPYKRPYGLRLPVNTQIPPGQTVEHRVPIHVADGFADCELHYKLYYPIEDHHPDLARMLESRRLVFDGVSPSDRPVETAPEVSVTTPEGVAPELASPANLVDYARPPIGTVEIPIPEGDDDQAISDLIAMFQFPVPEGNRIAQARLVEIGEPAVPALIEAMGSWDNKTWKQAMSVLERIGDPAVPYVVDALASDSLYVRLHARKLLENLGWIGNDEEAVALLRRDLTAENALDRASSARLLSFLRVKEAAPEIVSLLRDPDPDVVRAAGFALADLRHAEAIPAIREAMRRASFVETRRDLATALGRLGSADGIPELLAGLDHPDDLIRESCFEAFFDLTGLHLGYDPLMPKDERLAALARLHGFWARTGGPDELRPFPRVKPADDARAWALVSQLGGGAGVVPGGDDAQIVDELELMGYRAVPALVRGLKFPPGFAEKRTRICEALGRIGSPRAAPALMRTLRDPVVAVAAWACWALEAIGDPESLHAVIRYEDRIQTLAARGQVPQNSGSPDLLLAQAARARLVLGDRRARDDLVRFLLSTDPLARETAIQALERQYGERRGYDPSAPEEERRRAAAAWSSR